MKIAVLLSGGVDSSVALRLLHREGHELTAFYLKIWLEDELAFLGECPWEADLRFARSVCKQIGVPLEIVPLQQEYLARVVTHALDELRLGRTPSPDIFCNQRIKFGAFVELLDPELATVASGHYARLDRRGEHPTLRCGCDPVKDQTYFLSHLGADQLHRLCFPIGEFSKAEVRSLAAEFELCNQDRPDSQGICFLGKISYRDFVAFHLGEKEGKIVELDSGEVLGKHRGYWFHTIGQRHGLALSGGPWYVVGKAVDENVIYVAHGNRIEAHGRRVFETGPFNWISEHPSTSQLRVKLRHGPDFHECTVERTRAGGIRVSLEAPDMGVAPGQHAVLYEGDSCLGGGVISY
jgi:tRNA (5-methylaminomethyl-2-thiouridylate)-methyltransferase